MAHSPIDLVSATAAPANGASQAANNSANNRRSDDRVSDDKSFSKLVEKESAPKKEAPANQTSSANQESEKPVAEKQIADKPAPAERAQDTQTAQTDHTLEIGETDEPAKTNTGADAKFILAADTLLGTDGLPSTTDIVPDVVEAADPTSLAGGATFPDVTAIMPETASPVQPEHAELPADPEETGPEVMLTQPLNLLALASQIEQALALLKQQQTQPVAQPPTTSLQQISKPYAALPIVFDEASVDDVAVTPLLDVTTPDAPELPILAVKPVVPDAKTIAMTTLQQITKPAQPTEELMLNVTVEEAVDTSEILRQLSQPGGAAKAVQHLIEKSSETAGKTPEQLLTSLQQLIQARLARESAPTAAPVTAALPELPGQIVNAVNVDVQADLTDNQSSAGQQSVLNQLTATTDLGNTKPIQHAPEGNFAKMLQSAHTPPEDQVLVQIKSAVHQGSNQIKIQLSPADLGRVEVRMDVAMDGKTHMAISADNRDTLDMLQREASKLERALNDLGLKTDTGSLSFHLRNQNQEQQFASNKGKYTQVEANEIEAELQPHNATSHLYNLGVSEGVDIRV